MSVIEDGQRMALLLRDPLIVDAFVQVKADATQAWQSAKTPAEREECFAIVRAVDAIKLQMQVVADRGEHAEILRAREDREDVEG